MKMSKEVVGPKNDWWTFVLEIEVRPGAKKFLVKKNSEGNLKFYLNVPPVDGAANEELVQRISKIFGTPKSNIEIISGLKAKTKRIKILYHLSNKFTVSYFKSKLSEWYEGLAS